MVLKVEHYQELLDRATWEVLQLPNLWPSSNSQGRHHGEEHDSTQAATDKRQARDLAKDIPMIAELIFKGKSTRLPRLYGEYPRTINVKDPAQYDPVMKERDVLQKRYELIQQSQPKKLQSNIVNAQDATAKQCPQLARNFNTRAFYALSKTLRKKTTLNQKLNPETVSVDNPIAPDNEEEEGGGEETPVKPEPSAAIVVKK